jgi:glycosyltransferase involved in cell wall biosynthesis
MPTKDFEVIVVDDRSTDHTSEVLKNFEGIENLRIIRNEENKGVAGSANVGIRAARGQFVVRVDADDYVMGNMISHMSDYLYANHDAFGVSCDYVYVDNQEEKIERVYAEEKPISCGIMYRKDLLIEYGMYNEAFRHREEEELRKRIGERYKIHHSRMPFYRYRMHKENKTKQLDMMEEFRLKLEQVRSLDGIPLNIERESIDKRSPTERVAVVIPARGGSVRLPNKNIYPLLGKPMLKWVIDAARASRYITDVYVSTESSEIKRIAQEAGAIVIDRPNKLAEGNVYKQDVICHAVAQLTNDGNQPTMVISLQANSPEVTGEDLDRAIDHLLKFKKQEIISVDKNFNQNAAFRIMLYNTVFQRTLSTNVGFVVTDYVDIHDVDDVSEVEQRLKQRGGESKK